MNLKEAMKIIYALVVDAAGEGGDEEEQEAVDVFFLTTWRRIICTL
jgi:hypothetical protein